MSYLDMNCISIITTAVEVLTKYSYKELRP